MSHMLEIQKQSHEATLKDKLGGEKLKTDRAIERAVEEKNEEIAKWREELR